MNLQRKPRLGVLALMLEGYEPLFPGITRRQTDYVHALLEHLAPAAEFIFPGPAVNAGDMARLVGRYNAEGADGILILLLSYAQGQYLAHALRENCLPLALALVQPDESVGVDFGELELTVNQGIHGSQDCANALLRAGIPCEFYAGPRADGQLLTFVSDFAAAAATARDMRSMRIGVIGRLAGMGDVVTDDMAVYRQLGPEFVYDSIGAVQSRCAAVRREDIDERLAYEREVFDVDPAMPPERHAEAVRMYLGLKRYLEDNGYAGYTAHFEEFGADGRFTQLPLLAASSLMADGYGYAAEGDATAAMWMAAMTRLCGPSDFSEMYMMDFARDAILLCHAGEGNWALCRKDRKPFLMDRVFLEGGLSNPPTPIFCPEPGPAGVMSLAYLGDGKFRLVYAGGEILDECGLRGCDMPYLFFAPSSGLRPCVTAWLEKGGTHHEVIVPGRWEARIRLLCRILGIEFTPV